MGSLNIFYEGVDFELHLEGKIKSWLESSAFSEGLSIEEVNIIFCNDEYLLGLNRQYLDHDYYTDILTFDYSGGGNTNGDIYISIDRVRENAKDEGVSFLLELARVLIHGILHLAGFKDKDPAEKSMMRSAEDKYLKNISGLLIPPDAN